MIQAARLAFGFSGIKDEDEAQRMDEVTAPAVTPAPAPSANGSKLRAALGIEEAVEVAPETPATAPESAQDAPAAPETGKDTPDGPEAR